MYVCVYAYEHVYIYVYMVTEKSGKRSHIGKTLKK